MLVVGVGSSAMVGSVIDIPRVKVKLGLGGEAMDVMIRNKGLFWGSGANSIDVLHYLLKSSFKVSPPFKYLVCRDAQSFHFVSRIEELCTYSQSILYVSCI